METIGIVMSVSVLFWVGDEWGVRRVNTPDARVASIHSQKQLQPTKLWRDLGQRVQVERSTHTEICM